MKYVYLLLPMVFGKSISEKQWTRDRRIDSPISQFFLDDGETNDNAQDTIDSLAPAIPARIENPQQFLRYMKLFELM